MHALQHTQLEVKEGKCAEKRLDVLFRAALRTATHTDIGDDTARTPRGGGEVGGWTGGGRRVWEEKGGKKRKDNADAEEAAQCLPRCRAGGHCYARISTAHERIMKPGTYFQDLHGFTPELFTIVRWLR